MLQEIVFAPKNTMFYGDRVVDLLSVSRSQEWLFYKGKDIERSTWHSIYNAERLLSLNAAIQQGDLSAYQKLHHDKNW
jgi:hypothetical protein